MTLLIDLWRAIDPGARLLHGDPTRLGLAIRGVLRTRAVPPHLPPLAPGDLLVVDSGVLRATNPTSVLSAIGEAGAAPAAVLLAGVDDPSRVEPPSATWPVLASMQAAAQLADLANAYLDDERGFIARIVAGVRLSAAESALADPSVATPAGLVAGRLRRGLAVAVDGELRALHPRPAGRTLAARFAAIHARLLADSAGNGPSRRFRHGLWIAEHPIRPGASVWVFDDLPLARVDAAAAEALAITLRALLRRPPAPRREAGRPSARPAQPSRNRLAETLLAVARANGRVAPAARALGVHRNTVLYRLRRASAEYDIDPRRPEDAIRLLRDET